MIDEGAHTGCRTRRALVPGVVVATDGSGRPLLLPQGRWGERLTGLPECGRTVIDRLAAGPVETP